jgi:uncharacterized UPF0160 family protein
MNILWLQNNFRLSDAKRFDHHQKEFAEVFGHGFVTKLSSAGLVYKHYGI